MKYTNHCGFYTCGPLPTHKNGGGRLPISLGTPVFFMFMEQYALSQYFLMFLNKNYIDLVP